VIFGLCAGSYALMIQQAGDKQQAAVLSLPFMLFSTAAASSAVLAGVAAMDQRANRRA
jgi:hypothetical protein